MSVRDEYEEMLEVVPGVFLEDGSVYIVDESGEVCCWTHDEIAEDELACQAALCAVMLAAKQGAVSVRANLIDNGLTLQELVNETYRLTH